MSETRVNHFKDMFRHHANEEFCSIHVIFAQLPPEWVRMVIVGSEIIKIRKYWNEEKKFKEEHKSRVVTHTDLDSIHQRVYPG